MVAWRDCIGVQFERVGAVLEVVLGTDDLPWQLAELANRHKTRAEKIRDRRSKVEPARLHPDHHPRLMPAHELRQLVDRLLEVSRLLQQRGDVLEQDSLFRNVRYVATQGCEFVHEAGPLLLCLGETW